MPSTETSSLPGVADVQILRGAAAAPDAAPTLLLEVPHGATRAADFHDLRAALKSPLPDDLEAFYFVNTDVGAPELATALAARLVAAAPRQAAMVIRCRVPRTFIDCNRVLDMDAAAYKAGGVTPGVPPYITHPDDHALLRARYEAYRGLTAAAVQAVCGAGGLCWMVHSYAPRSVDVVVDEHIVRALRAAYEPEVFSTWPLRPEVDLIARTPDGDLLADPALIDRVISALAAIDLSASVGGTYPLHPSTLAYHHARAFPGRTFCLEVRRDLLASRFTPFEEMHIDPNKVDRVASALASAYLQSART